MDIEFYNLLNLKFKKKRDIPEIWDKIVNNIDDFISDFLKSFDIDIDFLYTTNVGLLNVNSNSRSSILWDLSYWSIYVIIWNLFFGWRRSKIAHPKKQYILFI